jgi:replication initiator protein A
LFILLFILVKQQGGKIGEMPARTRHYQIDESLVRVESNLEEYPLFAVKTRNRNENQLIFERRRQGENETELVQRWEVEPPAKLGMPGPFDQDVYLAVLQLLEMRGGMPRNGELDFSLYELRDILGWSTSGNTYEKIRQSLRRISSTTLTSENAFYSKAEERFLSDTFQIWTVHFSRTTRGKTTRERHTLRFHPIFIRNYMAQYLKGLDPGFYWSLPSPLSKRLYRLVDHQRDGRLRWQTDLSSLRQQVPLSNYSYPSEIKRVLEPAHEELMERGFLSGVSYEGKTDVSYEISPEFARRQKARELSGDPGELFAIERLVSEGIRGDVARNLVTRHGSARCLRYTDALESQRGLRSRAGWLRRAIEEGYELPDTLLPPSTLSEAPPPSSFLTDRDGDHTPREGAESEQLPDVPLYQDLEEEGEPSEELVCDPEAVEAWETLVADLTTLRGRDSLPPWFEQYAGGSLDGTTITVLVPNSTAANHLNENFGSDLLRLWRARAGADATLQVATDLRSDKRAVLTG